MHPFAIETMPGWVININDILCTVLLSWFLLFYCSVLQSIFSEVTTVTTQLNKTSRGPLGFCKLVWENYIWVHISLQKLVIV